MKLFGFNLGPSQSQPAQPSKSTSSTGFAFSTPFLSIGKGNLSAPYIDRNYTIAGIVQFGQDNLYPQLLNQLYYLSPMHGQCVEFTTNAVIGGGYSWVDQKVSSADLVDQRAFERANKMLKLSRLLTRDYVIHRRVCVVVQKVGTKTVKLHRLDPSTIRNNYDLTKFVFSSDWSRGQVETKTYLPYDGQNKGEFIYIYQDDTPGQDVYPIPPYNSALNWAFLDGEASSFHKANIQNSIFPSIVIRRPRDFSSVEEITRFKQEISSKTGADNAGRVLVLTGNGKDDLPEFDSVPANDNDKMFEVTAREAKESIAMAHGLNPSVMGVKVAGQLGNTQEILTSYKIFEKNTVMPLRAQVENILNDLVEICGVPNNLVINDYQLTEDLNISDQTELS